MPTRGRDPCSRFLATSLPLWSRVMHRKQRRFASIWAVYPNEGCEARNSNNADSRLHCGAQLSQGSAGEGILDENPFVALSVLHLAEDADELAHLGVLLEHAIDRRTRGFDEDAEPQRRVDP